jgi:hypothetical protein
VLCRRKRHEVASSSAIARNHPFHGRGRGCGTTPTLSSRLAWNRAGRAGGVNQQIELLQKQVETLEKMIKLLAEQLKKAPPDAEKVATLEARSVQAARRDVELANTADELREQADAQQRYGAWLGRNSSFNGAGSQAP